MQAKNLSNQLMELGLTEREAGIYLSALELGPSPVQKISAHARIARPTAYLAIEGLMKKQLMSSHKIGKKTLFTAGQPPQLEYVIKQQKVKIERQEKAINQIIAFAEEKERTLNDEIRVTSYEGMESMIDLYDFVLKGGSNDEVMQIANIGQMRKFIPPPSKNGKRAKIRATKKLRTIVGNIGDEKSGIHSEDRVLPKNSTIDAGVAIYGDEIIFTSFNTKINIIKISNPEISNTMKMLFNICWQASKPYNNSK